MTTSTTRRLRKAAILGVAIGSLYLAYRLGYEAGRGSKEPAYYALALRNKNGGASFTWFDVSIPAEAEALRREEARQKAAGADFYVAKGELEKSLRPAPEPSRVDAHR